MRISKSKLLIYGLLALFIGLHLFLISKTLFYDSSGNIRVAVSGYGDIPFHLTQVTKFSFNSLFNLNEPIFTGTNIKYAFFINWISGFVYKIIPNLMFAFHFPAMVFAAGGTIFSFLAFKRFLKKEWLALLAVIVFLLGTGFGGYNFIKDDFIGAQRSISEFNEFLINGSKSTVTRWDAEYPQQNIAWGAPMTIVLVHQRAFLLGYFLFALYFYLLLKYKENKDRKVFYGLIAILGLSPLAHYHSFVAMGFITVLIGLLSYRERDYDLFKKLVLILVLAAILSLPEVIYLVSGKDNIVSGSNSFIQMRLGWMTNPTIGSVKYPDDPNIFDKWLSYGKFLWINFGVILPLFMFTAIWGLWRKIDKKDLEIFILGGLLFFGLVQLFQFQPWDYDNNKLLVYYQFFAVPTIIWFIYKYGKEIAIHLLIVFSIFATFSGVIDIMPRFFVPEEKIPVIFDNNAKELAEYIRTNINEDDLILTSSTHLNVVSSIAGRPTLVGYPGWLWTKGINYAPREADAKLFYANPTTNLQILDKYDIKYVLLDYQAINDWGASVAVFDNSSRFERVFNKHFLILYKVKGL